MRSLRSLFAVAVIAVAAPVLAQSPAPSAPPKEVKKDEVCEPHGVKKSLCARCNPKLAAVFKAKGDWCQEHDRPESQCVLCNPELAKKGIK